MTRNGRGRRSQTSETPQPGSEQQTAPEGAAEDLAARLEQALSRIHSELRKSVVERRRRVAMRLVVEEMLNDPEIADAMKPYLAPSPEDWAEAMDESARERRDQDAAVAILAKARRTARSTLEEEWDVLWRHQELAEILRALELLHLKTAFALSVANSRSPEAAADVARCSVKIADELERIRETASGLLESAPASGETTRAAAQAVEAKSIAELRAAVDALSQSAEELRCLVRRILEDRLFSAVGADFPGETRRPFSARLADMLVLTPRLEPAEFDPGVPAAFEATGNAMACALIDAWAMDESRELAPSPLG